jgi:phosphoglucosamine mutase
MTSSKKRRDATPFILYGVANEKLMPSDVMKAAIAAGSVFRNGNHRHKVLIGKDPRVSSYMFETALTAGFTSVGMDVELTGPIPTPAVAILTASMRCDIGVMITGASAPFYENGVRMFSATGEALHAREIRNIRKRMRLADEEILPLLAKDSAIGRARRIDGAADRYVEYVKAFFPVDVSLEGFRVVVDCANGAAYKVAPWALHELGAEVMTVRTDPDGVNINAERGIGHLMKLREDIQYYRADAGIAFNGDGTEAVVLDAECQERPVSYDKGSRDSLVSALRTLSQMKK